LRLKDCDLTVEEDIRKVLTKQKFRRHAVEYRDSVFDSSLVTYQHWASSLYSQVSVTKQDIISTLV